jgi:hypothetical protein
MFRGLLVAVALTVGLALAAPSKAEAHWGRHGYGCQRYYSSYCHRPYRSWCSSYCGYSYPSYCSYSYYPYCSSYWYRSWYPYCSSSYDCCY